MRKYEIMFIVKPDLEEKTVKETVKKLEKTLTDNKAVITLSKELGTKEFAYEIKGFKSGFYYLYNIESNTDAAVKEFARIASIDEAVIRYLVINVEK
jgi:small subunit ribosomal protein S6